MTIFTTYSAKIKKDDGDSIACYRAFEDTVERYRQAVASARALYRAEQQGGRQEAVDQFARCIVNAGTILAPDRIVLFGSLASNPLLREAVVRSCKAYAPSFDGHRILHTALGGKEHYIGPSALFTMKKKQS